MQLPIDIKALIDEITNINEARATQISVGLYIDPAASPAVAAHVRSTFGSDLPNVRLAVTYLDASFVPYESDDYAVVVAGTSRMVGAAAAAIRAVGVPVMVVTTQPDQVESLARQAGYPIPEGDLVAPEGAMPVVQGALGASREGAQDARDAQSAPTASFTEAEGRLLDERMGQWVVTVCTDKRLAMAMAFPFLRRSLAVEAVQATSLQNAGIGLVPLIPGADLPIMTLNQAKMVLQIAAAYGQDMDKDRAKELAAVVGGAYVCRVVARELTEFVPVLGFVIKPSIAYGGTAAIGHAAIEYFEGGRDVAGVANVATRAAQAGKEFVANVKEQGPGIVPNAADKARDLVDAVPVVKEKIEEYAPKVVAVANELFETIVSQSAGRAGAAS